MQPQTIWNFSAGPAMLPQEVLLQAQKELLIWNNMGVSVMEMSHRSPEFEALAEEAKQDLRDLLNLPDEFEILFTAGGAQAQFALIPMNLLQAEEVADYVITGNWSQKAANEAKRFAQINVAADTESLHFSSIPDVSTWKLNPAAKYLHYVSNETVHGVQFDVAPQVNKPLVVDMSSDFLSRPVNFSGIELIYAGAQKNIGPAGLTVILIRKDLLAKCTERVPAVFSYPTLEKESSLANTPPTFVWYLASLVFKWLKRQGGLQVMQERNQHKAKILYQTIDESNLYVNKVDPRYRSKMNVIFDLKKEDLLPQFLAEAKLAGLLGLKGHKVRGGVRASIYNAMPVEGVQALIKFMQEFEQNI